MRDSALQEFLQQPIVLVVCLKVFELVVPFVALDLRGNTEGRQDAGDFDIRFGRQWRTTARAKEGRARIASPLLVPRPACHANSRHHRVAMHGVKM